MNWKQFLKPDKRKIAIFVILSIIFSYFLEGRIRVNELVFSFRGFPLPVHFCDPQCEILYPYLIINLVLWYLYSCIIVWLYEGLVKKHRKKESTYDIVIASRLILTPVATIIVFFIVGALGLTIEQFAISMLIFLIFWLLLWKTIAILRKRKKKTIRIK